MSRKWIIDEEAANVVKEIYRLFLLGNGQTKIAKILTERKVDSPLAHYIKKGLPTRAKSEDSNRWNASAINGILRQYAYVGHTVNFKTYKRSFKSKRNVESEEQNLARFVRIVKKYVDVEELTPEIVNAFIDRIEVGKKEKYCGRKMQDIIIVYNFVGAIELPQYGNR